MKWNADNIADQRGKVFVVTGGNTGIGLATVKVLAAKHAKVILACRSVDKGDAALKEIKAAQPDADVTVAKLDLADLASVRAFAAQMIEQLPRLDALINNAGVMTPPYSQTRDGFEMQFGTNVLGHFVLTGLLLPLLNKTEKSRVVTMSSVGHWFGKMDFDNLAAEKGYNKTMAYAQSKLADLIFAYELQRRLERSGSETISMGAHPGVTYSELGRNSPLFAIALRLYGQSTHDGALPALMAATQPQMTGGSYFGPGGFMTFKGPPTMQGSRRLSKDPELGSKLWEAAQRLTGVAYL